MVTGASTADLAIVLVDARNGLTEQSRRHAFLATLLRVPHLVLAVNKMDLVDYDAEVFERITEEFTSFATKLEIGDLTFIPISALHGDNVVQRSASMPWYDGPSLLHHLEHVHIASDRNLIDVRFPVQYVIRPHQATDPELHDYRGYAGQVAGGVLKPGDEVMHLPSGLTTTIARIDTARGAVAEAFPPMSVTLLLAGDLDVSRGDMFCRPHNQPPAAQDVEAMVCWMTDARTLAPRSRLIVKHTTRTVKAVRPRPALPARREHPAPGRGRHRAPAERDRAGDAAADPAGVLRPVHPQPDDRRPDPDRRGHQRHRRRGRDHRREVAGRLPASPRSAYFRHSGPERPRVRLVHQGGGSHAVPTATARDPRHCSGTLRCGPPDGQAPGGLTPRRASAGLGVNRPTRPP